MYPLRSFSASTTPATSANAPVRLSLLPTLPARRTYPPPPPPPPPPPTHTLPPPWRYHPALSVWPMPGEAVPCHSPGATSGAARAEWGSESAPEHHPTPTRPGCKGQGHGACHRPILRHPHRPRACEQPLAQPPPPGHRRASPHASAPPAPLRPRRGRSGGGFYRPRCRARPSPSRRTKKQPWR